MRALAMTLLAAPVSLALVASTKPVLVVGATGKTGRLVCERLSQAGTAVRALVRSPATAQGLDELPGVTVVPGDLLDQASLDTAVNGCSAVISVSGTIRPVQLSDLWTLSVLRLDDKADAAHPQSVNYRGTANVLAAMKKAGVAKIVRLTGLSCGFSAFNPFALIFGCLLLSMSTMWHARAENLLRADPAIDYTILRPGGLSDEARGAKTLQAGSCTLPKLANLGRADLAALAVACATTGAASRATVACGWAPPGEGASTWAPLLAAVPADAGPLPLKRYRLALATLLAALGVLGAAAAVGLARLFRYVWASGGVLGLLGL